MILTSGKGPEAGIGSSCSHPNLALEKEMDQLDAQTVRRMDPQAWYTLLLEKYFRWRSTAPNRYASTTASS